MSSLVENAIFYPMTKSSSAKPQWKAQEEVVARIERIAADSGALVKSPDRVRDLVTGRSREVDASIRRRIGSADILITVECRRRRDKDDVTWVEQLATKKENIGAGSTIAVSASGFSRDALSLAVRKGIALRLLNEMSDEEISRLIIPLVHVRPMMRVTAAQFFLGGSDRAIDQSEYPEWLNQALKMGADAPVLSRSVPGKISLNAVLLAALDGQGTKPFDDVPEDGTAVLKRIRIELPAEAFYLEMGCERKAVRLIVLNVWFYQIRKSVAPELAYNYQRVTSTDAGGAIRHSEFEVHNKGGSVRLTMQADEQEEEPRLSVEVCDASGQQRPAMLHFVRRGKLVNGEFKEWQEIVDKS